MLAAKPLTLALWLPPVYRGQAPGRGREMPTTPIPPALCQGIFPLFCQSFPLPPDHVPHPVVPPEYRRAFSGWPGLLVGVGVQWWAWWQWHSGAAVVDSAMGIAGTGWARVRIGMAW